MVTTFVGSVSRVTVRRSMRGMVHLLCLLEHRMRTPTKVWMVPMVMVVTSHAYRGRVAGAIRTTIGTIVTVLTASYARSATSNQGSMDDSCMRYNMRVMMHTVMSRRGGHERRSSGSTQWNTV